MIRQSDSLQQLVHITRRITNRRIVLELELCPRHELIDEGDLVGFQLRRVQEAAQACHVWNELGIGWIPAQSSYIEAEDEVASIVELRRTDESKCDGDAV